MKRVSLKNLRTVICSVDMEEAVKKSMPYKVSKYLLIAKAHVLKGGTIQNPLFVNDEEELFFQVCFAIKHLNLVISTLHRF